MIKDEERVSPIEYTERRLKRCKCGGCGRVDSTKKGIQIRCDSCSRKTGFWGVLSHAEKNWQYVANGLKMAGKPWEKQQ